MRKKLTACFDANAEEQSDQYNIVLTSDVLAEGINLHRSNIIVNYDSPWNASRLMQRIGRVNRIGSVAGKIHNYLFYPSDEGNRAIGLSENSLFKLQGFHSALGEDIQIYSPEEIVKEFKLFDKEIKDSVDENLRYLRIVRDFHTKFPHEYARIKALPPKSRVMRHGDVSESVAFIASNRKTSYFIVKNGKAKSVDFLTVARKLEADQEEHGISFDSVDKPAHYRDVQAALDAFLAEFEAEQARNDDINNVAKSKPTQRALAFLRKFKREKGNLQPELADRLLAIEKSVRNGVYTHLERRIINLSDDVKGRPLDDQYFQDVENEINDLFDTYLAAPEAAQNREPEGDPLVVVTETFVKEN